MPLALEELTECVSDGTDVETQYLRKETAAAVNRLLDTLGDEERNIFLRRYWFLDSTADIAARYGISQSKVSTTLHRTRKKLRAALEQEGLL